MYVDAKERTIRHQLVSGGGELSFNHAGKRGFSFATGGRRLAVSASLWYEQHGLFAEAIETAFNAAAFTRFTSIIQQYIESK